MENRIKYPRSLHLPWSPGATSDDKMLRSTEHFEGREVVETEKLDGENTTIYSDRYCHARSLDSAHHDSRSWVKALAARVSLDLPAGWRVCGENVFAQHSVGYDRLSTYFYVFSIWDEDNNCLSWDDTVTWCGLLGLSHVPVLYRGPWNEEAVKEAWTGCSAFADEGEGYVVRLTDGFSYGDFSVSLAKWVRKGHVNPDDTHWMHREVVPNSLEG